MKKLVTFFLLVSIAIIAQAEIIVDNHGYLPFAKKEALTTIKAESFELRDKDSGREKYKGALEGPLLDPDTGEGVYRLNFTEKVRGGQYFLTVGTNKSSAFKVDSRAFNPVFVEAMRTVTARRSTYGWLDDLGEENILLTTYMSARGLSFFETFSDRFADNELQLPPNEQNNKVPDFLDEMIYGVKGLIKWYEEGNLASKDINSLSGVASVLAIAGRVLPKADPALAKQCADKAEEAYNYLKANRQNEIRADLRLLLLSELNLLTDNKLYEKEFRDLLKPVLDQGWGPITPNDLTGFSLGEMMKKSLPKEDEIYDLYMSRGIGLLIAHERDPYYRTVAYKPVETEFKAIYLTTTLPEGVASEGLYLIDVNEYYRTNTWVRVAQDQMHYLLGRNRAHRDYLQQGSLETVFNLALLTAYFKDSSTITRSGQIVGGALKITFYFVLIFAGITLWQKYSSKKIEKDDN